MVQARTKKDGEAETDRERSREAWTRVRAADSGVYVHLGVAQSWTQTDSWRKKRERDRRV